MIQIRLCVYLPRLTISQRRIPKDHLRTKSMELLNSAAVLSYRFSGMQNATQKCTTLPKITPLQMCHSSLYSAKFDWISIVDIFYIVSTVSYYTFKYIFLFVVSLCLYIQILLMFTNRCENAVTCPSPLVSLVCFSAYINSFKLTFQRLVSCTQDFRIVLITLNTQCYRPSSGRGMICCSVVDSRFLLKAHERVKEVFGFFFSASIKELFLLWHISQGFSYQWRHQRKY